MLEQTASIVEVMLIVRWERSRSLKILYIIIFISNQVNSVISAGGSYSDVESGEEEDNVLANMGESNGDVIDENKFFAGVITSQRSDDDLIGFVYQLLLQSI